MDSGSCRYNFSKVGTKCCLSSSGLKSGGRSLGAGAHTTVAGLGGVGAGRLGVTEVLAGLSPLLFPPSLELLDSLGVRLAGLLGSSLTKGSCFIGVSSEVLSSIGSGFGSVFISFPSLSSGSVLISGISVLTCILQGLMSDLSSVISDGVG